MTRGGKLAQAAATEFTLQFTTKRAGCPRARQRHAGRMPGQRSNHAPASAAPVPPKSGAEGAHAAGGADVLAGGATIRRADFIPDFLVHGPLL
jgi:hypothetical protein